jgi:hypothetical protein
VGEPSSLITGPGIRKSKDVLEMFTAKTEEKSPSLLNGGKVEEEEMIDEEVGHETARVMEWMNECEEPVLMNLLDDVVKNPGEPRRLPNFSERRQCNELDDSSARESN